MTNSESKLSRLKIHYEYTEDYIDVLSFFKKLRKKNNGKQE